MSNCRYCSNLISINEKGESERRCKEGLDTKDEDHDCEKYIKLDTCCYDCS